MTGYVTASRAASQIPQAVATSPKCEVGDIVYMLEWKGTAPRLLAGEIVGIDEKTITLRDIEGGLFQAKWSAPTRAVFHDPREAVFAELQWLRWCMPHDAICDSASASRRAVQLSALMDLWKSLSEGKGIVKKTLAA